MRSPKVAFVLVCLLALQGCAAAALSVVGMAGGAGLDHTLNGYVYRTYASPVAGTRLAALQTLKRMGMTIEKSEKAENGWVIEAKALDRDIDIDLETLSARSTRARVVVSQTNFIFLKDSATGNEIIDQMSVELSRLSSKRLRLATAQMLLDDLGFDPGEADGLMGKKTRNAIFRYQRRNALRVDGKVSARLITSLERRQRARAAAAKKNEQATPADRGEWFTD